LTASLGYNTTYKRKNKNSKIIDMANCKLSKTRLFTVEYAIWIIHYYQTGKTRECYESSDEPFGRLADNPSNSDGLGDFD